MAEVLTAHVHLDGYYRRSSPSQCLSASPPPYDGPNSYAATIPRSHRFTIPQEPTPPSSASSSPQLSTLEYSEQPSTPSSVASSLSLGDVASAETDDGFFPNYNHANAVSPPSPEELSTPCIPGAIDCTAPIIISAVPASAASSHANSSEYHEPLVAPADDSVIRHEPSRHVDYLSHDWKEEDIWSSWRYMVGKRKVYNNAARLENASWRTWTKAKYKLKTVSPETLNWLKDCDVTWLYGPLSTGQGKVSLLASPTSPLASPTETKLPSSGSFYRSKKPILKKRSMSEVMLQRSLSNSSLLKQAAAAIESQQSENSIQPPRPVLSSRAHSDFSAFQYSSKNTSAIDTSDLPSALSTGYHSPSFTRHIHFNNQVQQCIAVDKEEEEEEEDDDAEGAVLEVRNFSESSSEDEGLVMMPKSKGSARSSARGSFSEPQTIAMLPSTTLKYEEVEIKKSGRFSSFFSAGSAPSLESTPTIVVSKLEGIKSYFLEEDDEDLAEIDWQPSGAFANNRRDSVARQGFDYGRPAVGFKRTSDDDDFELPKYSYNHEEEDEVAPGIFGRAVDAVNTARDIAHVLWNVGWRR